MYDIYAYIYLCIQLYTYRYICTYHTCKLCIYIHIYMYVHIRIIHACVCVRMYVCIYVCIYMHNLHVCVCVYASLSVRHGSRHGSTTTRIYTHISKSNIYAYMYLEVAAASAAEHKSGSKRQQDPAGAGYPPPMPYPFPPVVFLPGAFGAPWLGFPLSYAEWHGEAAAARAAAHKSGSKCQQPRALGAGGPPNTRLPRRPPPCCLSGESLHTPSPPSPSKRAGEHAPQSVSTHQHTPAHAARHRGARLK